MANQVRTEFIVTGVDQSLNSVDKFEKKIVDTENHLTQMGKRGNDAGRELAQGLGIPLGPTAALVAGIGLLTVGIAKSMQAAREGADANRVLGSSATEAGLSYDLATEKAQKFAEQTGLSSTQAKQTFSSIIQVAKVAGETGDLDNIQKRFADLAAARGVAAKDLSTLAQQILSGQDEALNRLGLADPSKLAAEWAKANGRTVESMTQMELVQSRLDAVVRKGAMFDGSAEERLNSVSGQIIKTEQAVENLTTGIGDAIFANTEFRDLLTTINQLLGSISLNADEVRKKLKDGLSPKQIAEQESGGLWESAKFLITSPLLSAEAVRLKALGRAQESEELLAMGKPGVRQAIEIQIAAENEKKGIDAQKKAAADQKQINEDKTKSDAALVASKLATASTIKSLQVAISRDENLPSQIAGIQKLRQEIQAFGVDGSLSATEVKDKLVSLDEQIFQTQKKIQETIIATFKDSRTFLDDMTERVNKDNPFVKLFSEADTVMERMQKRFGAFGSEFVGMMAKVENQAVEMELLAARIQSAQKVLDIQAEIRKLQFGQIGTSAEDQRRLGVFDKRIAAARDIPGLEASARAVQQGRFPGQVDQGAILNQQIEEIRKLRISFSGSAFGQREAQSKINEQIIALFSGATPGQQAALLRRGDFKADLSGAFQGQADDRRQAIQDELKRAEVGRFAIEAAQKKLADLKRFGGFDNEEVRKQFLAVTGSLSEGELTPELRRGRIGALDVEAKKEAEKEKKAEEDRKLLNSVLEMLKAQITGKGLKVDQAGTGLLIEVKDTSNKASVTGPAFDAEQGRRDMQGL